jgi:hypothetical protein
MAHDPGETKNVAADRLEDVARLRALLAEHPEPRPPLVGPAADRSPKRPLRGVAR